VVRGGTRGWGGGGVSLYRRAVHKVLVVTFPLCAPEHLVLPGAQIVDLVSCLAIMSVWSRSKLRVCCEQPME